MEASQVELIETSAPDSTSENRPGRGAAKLREAADEVLCRDSKDLAEALSKNGKDGKIQSTKFMYQLSETGSTADGVEDPEKLRSVALELANAPQWTGPRPSEMSEDTDADLAD